MNMKLSTQGLSSMVEFKLLIKSIGFKKSFIFYKYKEYYIGLYDNYYSFRNGLEFITYIPYTDLTPVLKLSRSIKLKNILG